VELDSLPQTHVAAALAIQDIGALRGPVRFHGRQEDGLGTLRVGRHGIVLESASPFRTRSEGGHHRLTAEGVF
jgi:hypothetical protein